MSQLYASQDIWLSSYLLSEGAELVDFQMNQNGRTAITFCMKGENLNQLAKDYCDKKASANVVLLRNKLNFLRDIIFTTKKRN